MKHAQVNSENRQQHRLEIQDELMVTDINTGNTMGQLANLSVEGLMLSSTEPVRLNTIYRLRIPLSAEGVDDSNIEVRAESLWCEDVNGSGSYWTGFHICEISSQDQEILNKIVGV